MKGPDAAASPSRPALFAPLRLRGVTLPNRIGVSPMCQYSSVDGMANDWHLVHLGAFAKGGAGLVMVEATAVAPEGRISPADLGLWNDDQIAPLARIAAFVSSQGAVAGIQIAHAGRKASTSPPSDGEAYVEPADGGWPVVGPSPIAFAPGYGHPSEMTVDEIAKLPSAFADAARRAVEAGFRVVEVHAAHGYLIHEFLSPLSNRREDAWGGAFENRTRLLEEVCAAVRAGVGDEPALFVRVSATEWVEGGWDADDTVRLARRLRGLGVDLVDCSTGGNTPDAKIVVGPGYQVGFAERVRREAGIPSAAVGLITRATQADKIVGDGRADLVLLGRELLRHPAWAHDAASALGRAPGYPRQYAWALHATPRVLAAAAATGPDAD
jgi:2,4-dienoyl-CoA reductase-like NADH-dependent reductase (Old Yellow Enzyme family)